MIVGIFAYAGVVGWLLAFAAFLLEHAASSVRRPRRWPWAIALTALLVSTLVLPWRIASARVEMEGASATDPLATVTASLRSWWTTALISPESRRRSDFDRIALVAWSAASASLLALYGGRLASLRRRRARWAMATLGTHRFLVSDDVGPAVIGCLSTSIVVPAWALALDPPQVSLLIRHERAHQTAGDAMLIHAAEVAVAAVPWNPAAWWMRARLRAAVELDCDARVLAGLPADCAPDAERQAYGTLLLSVASRSLARATAIVPALIERPSVLRRRLMAMQPTAHRLVRSRLTSAVLAAAALALAASMLPVPALHAQYDEHVGGYRPGTPGLRNPRVVEHVNAAYTPEAMRQKIEGTVAIEGVVTVDGVLDDSRITKSVDATHGLDEEALKAARLWRFRPGTLDGKPVPVVVTIEMVFRLRH
jgi:TonB family protein